MSWFDSTMAVSDPLTPRRGQLPMSPTVETKVEPGAETVEQSRIEKGCRWFIVANVIALAAVSLWFRVTGLNNLPGINGDEAWYGVQVLNMLAEKWFSLRTPSGLPLNPFFISLEAPFLCAFQPSFWILRAPAVISGLIAVVLALVLGSRMLDRTTALLAALLLAVLPSTLGYSRFGWDASQIPLFSLLVIYFGFRGNGLGSLLSFVACLIVHASSVFLLPVAVALFAVTLWRQQIDPAKRKMILWITAAIGLIPLVTWILLQPGSERLSLLLERAAPQNWLRFLQHYGRLITGVSLNHFVVGPLNSEADRWSDGVFWSLVLGLLVLGVPRLAKKMQWDRIALLIGLALGATALYLATGPELLRPDRGRFGLYLVVPTILGVSCLASSLLPESNGRRSAVARQACLAALVLCGWAGLFAYKSRYIDALKATGGESHVTFRTAAVEPKQRALQLILDDISQRGSPRLAQASNHPKDDDRGCPILAENWSLYWPLRFLSWKNPNIEIISPEGDGYQPYDHSRSVPELVRFLDGELKRFLDGMSAGGYAVAFADERLEHRITTSIPADRRDRWDINDYAGRRLMSVFRIKRAP